MRSSRLITTVDLHAEGEIGRVVTSGVPIIPGATMAERMRYINETDDSLRRFLVQEPRAAAQMSTNLLMAPMRPDADAAFLVLQVDRAHAMSGSNAICVTTALIETGMIAMREPETIVRLDTPAGLVTARARCRTGACERVVLAMTPAFAEALEVRVKTKGYGWVTGDIAFGGVYYFLVDSAQIGLTIEPANARALVAAGIEILAAANAALDIRHPENPAIFGVSYVMFRAFDDVAKRRMRNATILWPGRIDRSPCGTGSTARAAVMVARGEAKIGDELCARSIIGSEFSVRIAGAEPQGAGARGPIVRVEIGGRAWIYATGQMVLDPADPFPSGFTLSDTWGPGLAPATTTPGKMHAAGH